MLKQIAFCFNAVISSDTDENDIDLSPQHQEQATNGNDNKLKYLYTIIIFRCYLYNALLSFQRILRLLVKCSLLQLLLFIEKW
jgi:hypothetical protein